MTKPYEGLFITLEGGDGCGKTTLAEKLCREFEKMGYSVVKTREPGGSQLSEQIRSLLLNPSSSVAIGDKAELFLYLAARAQHTDEKILPALREGKVVICERFNDSTIAYQGCARNLGSSYVESICKLASQDLEPNATLFLDLAPEIGLARLASSPDRLEKEKLQFHREVRQGYLHLADKYPNRIFVIDAAQTPEQVFEAALKALRPHLMLKPSKRK